VNSVVFIGASKFGKRCLLRLLDIPDIVLVGTVTAPRDFCISYSKEGVTNVLHADVTQVCEEHNIPIATITDGGMKDEVLFETVKSWQPDFFIVAGWYHMVPKSWRNMAPAYGLHASLLPDYSGGAPLVWAIINGEKETGITFFQFAGGVDNGPIVGQASTPIHEDDTIATLYARIEEQGLGLLESHVKGLADGSAVLTAQDESRRRTMPQRKPQDGEIDWKAPAQKVYDFIRAQTRPYPGAFFKWRGHTIHIWATRPVEGNASAGMLGLAHGDLIVNCGDQGALQILDLSVDGEDISVDDFIKRYGDAVTSYGAKNTQVPNAGGSFLA
jgi:methionyl-tRNA formyltransferase